MLLIQRSMPDHKANADRQKSGAAMLAEQMEGFYLPSKSDKKRLLKILGISDRFMQTFDAVRLSVSSVEEVQNAKDFDLLEIKTTGKCLPSFPQGFFFGMTENEEMLLKVFEDKFFLCLVCVHPKSPGYTLLGWDELKGLIQNKRVQFQINLKGKARAATIK
jgi:hypothetical protein